MSIPPEHVLLKLQVDKARLSVANRKLEATNKILRDKNGNLTHKLAHGDQEIKKIRASLDLQCHMNAKSLSAEVASLSQANTELSDKISNLDAKLAESDEENKKLLEANNELYEKNGNLDAKLALGNENYKWLRRANKGFFEKNGELEAQLTNSSEENKKLFRANNQLFEKYRDLEAQLADSNVENEKLTQANIELSDQKDDLEARLNQESKWRDTAVNDHRVYTDHQKASRKFRNRRAKKIKKLYEEVQTQKQVNAELQSRNEIELKSLIEYVQWHASNQAAGRAYPVASYTPVSSAPPGPVGPFLVSRYALPHHLPKQFPDPPSEPVWDRYGRPIPAQFLVPAARRY